MQYIYIYIYIYICKYTVMYTTSGLFISHIILVSCAAPLLSQFQCLNCLGALSRDSVKCSLRLCSASATGTLRGCPAPAAIAPHPDVELIEPVPVAFLHAGICRSSVPIAEPLGQGGVRVAADIARRPNGPIWSVAHVPDAARSRLPSHGLDTVAQAG
jgi:hypothetical protein